MKFESQNRMLTRKLQNIEKEIQKYEKKYNELRSYVKTIEVTMRSKGKYDSEAKYEQDMMNKLKTFEDMANQAETEYYEGQI